jgi:hypothetical protein
MSQHGKPSLVDDLCWGHGDGLLGSVEGTTESIAGPLKGVDVQPRFADWRYHDGGPAAAFYAMKRGLGRIRLIGSSGNSVGLR